MNDNIDRMIYMQQAFSLEKHTGKKCYMVGARGLHIWWGDVPEYWKFTSLPESRLSQVAELDHVWWFDVKTRFGSKLLSPNTTYGVYFVFKFGKDKQGVRNRHVEFQFKFEQSEIESKKVVNLDTAQPRKDGWQEVDMAEFFTEHTTSASCSSSI
ncbi:hypothetical protein L6164_013276 [Bauhinia variegata]|uniref:Uncharacterized protein n=1 Tax=Bauhinia variegata TaxID=167791 RepID=A0ACB9PE21_BAUVA|nr:hypothetical protein L6164_013276 [Bauhinia variegata]